MSQAPHLHPRQHKHWFESKTIWVNLLALFIALLSAAEPLVPALSAVLPPKLYAYIGFGLPLVNVALRFITTQPLFGSQSDAPDAPDAPSSSQGGFVGFQAIFLIGLVMFVGFSAYRLGVKNERSDWLEREAEISRVAQQARDKLQQLSDQAVELAIKEQAREAERNAHLSGVMNHARKQFPLLARSTSVAANAAHTCAGDTGSVRSGAASPDQPQGDSAPPQIELLPWPVPVDPDLTLGAVWLWNASLTGQADAPAGACRVDEATGQADPACAQPSGLDLDAAWANQAANAASCREDRARYQRLIDYLNKISSPNPATP